MVSSEPQHLTEIAASLRAEIARSLVPAYVIAGIARIHPSYLSRLLRGHTPVTDDMQQRIRAAIRMAQPSRRRP